MRRYLRARPVAPQRCSNARPGSRNWPSIAGPGGGTAEKPVGTVFIARASAAGVEVKKFLNVWDRATFKEVAATQALEWLRQTLSA